MRYGFNDIYVLAPERSASAALHFLDDFLPNREPAAEEYQFPQFSDSPEVIFRDSWEAMCYCDMHPGASQSFYFSNTTAQEPAHAMLFFTPDGGMICGVSTRARQDELSRQAMEIAEWLEQLRTATAARFGYALWESHPPCESIQDFLDGLTIAMPPKLLDGNIILPEPGEMPDVVFLDWRK